MPLTPQSIVAARVQLVVCLFSFSPKAHTIAVHRPETTRRLIDISWQTIVHVACHMFDVKKVTDRQMSFPPASSFTAGLQQQNGACMSQVKYICVHSLLHLYHIEYDVMCVDLVCALLFHILLFLMTEQNHCRESKRRLTLNSCFCLLCIWVTHCPLKWQGLDPALSVV